MFIVCSPLLHLDVTATMYVLTPQRGDLLSGIVTKITAHSISLLIEDTFHASISEQHLHTNYEFQGNHYTRKEEGGEDGDEDAHSISLYTKLTFSFLHFSNSREQRGLL